MTEEINYESLADAVQEQIDDSIITHYDLNSILRSAELCWDNTAVMVKANDFIMVFDLIGYELLDYTGNDIN